ncbi:MAG: hypothetical protein NTZ05_13250, partial [Chloroflexi bacterium]|nr:hypothetical protein [Chloroflexota bacterium]
MVRRGFSWLLTFALALSSGFLALPLVAHAAELTLSASSGVAGGPIMVSGSGFAASGTVTLRWNTAAGAVLASAGTNASGVFTDAAAAIPADAAPGAHQLFASDGALTISTSVTVLPGAVAAVTPPEGAAGGAAIITGHDFAADAAVTVRWEGEDGAALAATTATADGSIVGVSVVIPVAAAPGVHHLFVTDGSLEATVAFTVTAGTTLTVAPASALPATNLLASGAGYGAGAAVTLRWDAADGAALATATAGSSGAIDGVSVVVPAAAAAGAHTVYAGDGTHSASAAVTVLAPAATLSVTPASQIAGSAVSASGSGYGANEQVTLRWDSTAGSVLTTVTTDGAGAFSGAAVTVPAAATLGAHSVVGVGGAGGRQASAAVTVLASTTTLTLNPASQVAGGTVTAAGAGYAPSSTVTIRWDTADGAALATATAGSSGAVSALSVVIPAGAAAGAHVVYASDGTHSASAQVTVLGSVASLTINPASQTAGGAVTASGAGYLANEQVALRWDAADGGVLMT